MKKSPCLTQGQIPTHCELRVTTGESTCFASPVVAMVESPAGTDSGDRIICTVLYACQGHANRAARAIEATGKGILTYLEEFNR